MRRFLFVAMIGATVPATAAAQHPECQAAPTQTRDGCQKAVDLFQYMAPQLGTVIAGGNATLGQGSTLGGFPNFVVSVRANAVQGSLPRVNDVAISTTGMQQSSYITDDQMLGLPAVDAAVGVFGGLPFGVTRVGGIDLLLNASYIPEYTGEAVEVVTPDGGFKLGYGVRIGLLEESLVVPGLSVTVLKRDLPTVNLHAASGGDSVNVRELGVETFAWRVVASKNLVMFGLAAGVGQDRYTTGAQPSVVVNDPLCPSGVCRTDLPDMAQELTRTTYFADLSMNLFIAKLVAEVGLVSGGEVETYNEFDTPADDARLYGSVGLRIGF